MKMVNITKKFGENAILKDFNYEVTDNKINCILGASGYGKTTILNIIAGSTDYQGIIEGGGSCSYIFQEQRLVPSLTVFKNIELVLEKQIESKQERKKAIDSILEQVGVLDRKDDYPGNLSGGMAQRVALARAFAYKADILLMDEPFNGLDVNLKKKMLDLFLELLKKNPKTVIFVTHSIDECLLLADKLAILSRPPAPIGFTLSIDIPQKKRSLTSDSLHQIRLEILKNY